MADREEKPFFAPHEIHSIMQEQKLGVGSEFLLERVQNGKKGSSKFELSILGKAPEVQNTPAVNKLREVLLNCIHDPDYVAKNSGLQFSLDQIQKLATTLFIARSKAY